MSSKKEHVTQLTLESFKLNEIAKKFTFQESNDKETTNKNSKIANKKKIISSSDSDDDIEKKEKVNSFCVESLNNFFICSPKISKHKVSSNLSNSSATSSEKARKDNDLVKLSSNDEDSITESKLAQEKKREREEDKVVKGPKAKKHRVILPESDDSDSDGEENSKVSNKSKKTKILVKRSTDDNSHKKESKSNDNKDKKKKKKKTTVIEEDPISLDRDYMDDSEGGSNSSDDDLTEKGIALRESVLKFFNDVSISEMQSMISITDKRAKSCIERRPFKSYKDLKKRLSEISMSNLIDQTKEVLNAREIVNELMNKCEKISTKLHMDIKNFVDKKCVSIDMKTSTLKIKTQPKLLNPSLELKPYQLIGLNWLCLMHQSDINGILADEMGLGKTIQAIAFLAFLLETGSLGLHLIVVPPSTLDNWLNEIELWCPAISYIVYTGSQDERNVLRYDILENQFEKPLNVLITTYSMISSTAEDKAFFSRIKFNYCIFDEAHMLKNMASIRYQSLLKIRAKRKLLLTGTPLQNNIVELMSLLTFVMPEIFYTRTEHIRKLFLTKESAGKENNGSYYNDKITQAKGIMKPFILRRLKTEVLQNLPKKHVSFKYGQMTERQGLEYKKLVSNYLQRSEEILKENVNDKEVEKSKTSWSNIIMQLRKAANHPLLIRSLYNDQKIKEMAKLIMKVSSPDTVFEYVVEDMSIMSDFELHKLCSSYPTLSGFELSENQLLDSGKFKMLDELLPEKKSTGQKVLIFSQFVIMLDIIEEYLKIRNFKYLRLDGNTVVSDRQDMIDDYNRSEELFVFIISTRAGGMGINLTSANVVVLHDIDYNPYNDKQAEDRCHRVGQTKEVEVFKLISNDSIDESMLKIQNKKIQLGENLTNKPNDSQTKSDMISLIKEALNLKKDI